MRHVIMRLNISGTRDGVNWPSRGEGIDLPDVEAADMIAAGHAIAADVERASVSTPVRTATVSTSKASRAGR